jgi:hypothetical protein
MVPPPVRPPSPAAIEHGSAPDVLVPDVLVPEVDVPDVLVPDVLVPEVLVPDVDVPEVDVPEVDVPEVDVPEVDVPEVDVPDVLVPEVDVPEVVWPQPGGGELSEPAGLVGGQAFVVEPPVPLVPFVEPLVPLVEPLVPPFVPFVPLSVPQPGGGEFVDCGVGGGHALPVSCDPLPANATPGIVNSATTNVASTNGSPRRFIRYSLPLLEPAWK